MSKIHTLYKTSHPSMLYVASLAELMERFSFYIVEALLIIYLIDSKHLSQEFSYELLGTYIANSFVLTIFGAYFGQNIIGFRNAVNFGSCLMAIGYSFLLSSNIQNLYYALGMISVGSAFFKPNMACFVGSLYPVKSSPTYHAAYNTYYSSIMIGVILSTSISGYVLHYLGWSANFTLAAISMSLSFIIFLIGRNIFHDQEYALQRLFKTKTQRWALTLSITVLLLFCVHAVLKNILLARLEIGIFSILLLSYFAREIYQSSFETRKKFITCIALLFFSGMYWALLFQLFFSFNIMIESIINRHFLEFELPPSLFMGFESLIVIVTSPLLARLWIKRPTIGLFKKFTSAFIFCFLGLLTLVTALNLSSTPSFLWILGAYTFIGIGEAILAPTALAMIAQLIKETQIGVMMAALYIFWGCGTKLAGTLAEWSIFPSSLHQPQEIAPYFAHAILLYTGISFGMILLGILGNHLFQPEHPTALIPLEKDSQKAA